MLLRRKGRRTEGGMVVHQGKGREEGREDGRTEGSKEGRRNWGITGREER